MVAILKVSMFVVIILYSSGKESMSVTIQEREKESPGLSLHELLGAFQTLSGPQLHGGLPVDRKAVFQQFKTNASTIGKKSVRSVFDGVKTFQHDNEVKEEDQDSDKDGKMDNNVTESSKETNTSIVSVINESSATFAKEDSTTAIETTTITLTHIEENEPHSSSVSTMSVTPKYSAPSTPSNKTFSYRQSTRKPKLLESSRKTEQVSKDTKEFGALRTSSVVETQSMSLRKVQPANNISSKFPQLIPQKERNTMKVAKLEIPVSIGMLSPPAMKMITISLPMPSRPLENTAGETTTLAGKSKHSAMKMSNKAGEPVKISKIIPFRAVPMSLRRPAPCPSMKNTNTQRVTEGPQSYVKMKRLSAVPRFSISGLASTVRTSAYRTRRPVIKFQGDGRLGETLGAKESSYPEDGLQAAVIAHHTTTQSQSLTSSPNGCLSG
ncbi:unnamed protein product [Angiostrongylus costaricensis]|uniref:LEM domain-containing protein n=1 Tax=Angiostrongylus costaricensis TaxID=334426 RepID=A0A0R3PQR2_ANGCS|nr:unnamed protein product [Angiostrongylus costaricensis]